MRNFYPPVYRITEHRRRVADKTSPSVVSTGQPQPASGVQSWIARALSLLGSCIIEGFGAYGESICPCLHDLPEHYSNEEPARLLHHWGQRDGAERDEIGTAKQPV